MYLKTSTLFISFTLLAVSASAQSEEKLCGIDYEVKQGDTLSKLSKKAYGDPSQFMRFYEIPQNLETLGKNPNQISVGVKIRMPACDGAPEVVEAAPRTVDDKEAVIMFLTGSDFAPFTHEDLPDGGMLTKIVDEAMDLSGLKNPSSIDFVNDWGSHLETLIPNGAYDLGFPWYKPNCDRKGILSENMQLRCEYKWSEPLYSEAVGFYMPLSAENKPTSFEGFHDKKICRPEGYWTFDLEENGLINGETYTLVQPKSVVDCFKLLESGEVDAVSLNRFTAEDGIAAAGLTGLVAPLEGVVTTQTLHVVAWPENAEAVKWLDAFNGGLKKLQDNGRYQQIVDDYTKLHEERTKEQ